MGRASAFWALRFWGVAHPLLLGRPRAFWGMVEGTASWKLWPLGKPTRRGIRIKKMVVIIILFCLVIKSGAKIIWEKG